MILVGHLSLEEQRRKAYQEKLGLLELASYLENVSQSFIINQMANVSVQFQRLLGKVVHLTTKNNDHITGIVKEVHDDHTLLQPPADVPAIVVMYDYISDFHELPNYFPQQ